MDPPTPFSEATVWFTLSTSRAAPAVVSTTGDALLITLEKFAIEFDADMAIGDRVAIDFSVERR